MKNKSLYLPAMFVFILLLIKSFNFLDPDFGWHLKMGEIILIHGIPSTDPFSYSMSSFPIISHEWLMDVFLFSIYKNIGWFFLAVLFSLITILAIVLPVIKYRSFVSLPILTAGFALFLPAGIRPQVFSWLFFSILITILFDDKTYNKLRFSIPLLFILWVNFHGSFVIGLATYFVFLILKIWKERAIGIIDLSLIVLSFFAIFINPYGIHIWREVFMTATDQSLKWSIQEWKPYIFTFYPILWFYVTTSVILLFKFRKNIGLFQKTIYLILILAGFSSVRHMAFWVILATPILVECLNLLNSEAKKIKYGELRYKKAYVFLTTLAFLIFILPILKDVHQLMLFNQNYFYPNKAVTYLKSNTTTGNVFSEYDWGGYLIWKYPEKKVYIDGRMPSWRWNGGKSNESNYAFSEYKNLLDGNIKFNDLVKKYNIDTVLWSVPEKKKNDRISAYIENLEHKFSEIGEYGSLSSQLERLDWEIVYKDETSIIFRKPE